MVGANGCTRQTSGGATSKRARNNVSLRHSAVEGTLIPFTPKTPTTLYYDPASSSRATRQGLSIQTRLLALVAAAALPLVVFGLAEMRLPSRQGREATEQDALQTAPRNSAARADPPSPPRAVVAHPHP